MTIKNVLFAHRHFKRGLLDFHKLSQFGEITQTVLGHI